MPSDLEIALSRLNGVKKISGGYQAHCPCHDDKHQSLSLKEDKGKILLYCHAGCAFEDIIKELDLRPDTIKVTNDTPVITDTYDYASIEGLPYQTVRYLPKAFKHRRPDGKGGWIWNMNGLTPSLYHLSEVIEAIANGKLVFIVEGEKDANNLRKNGQVATTISGGASTKWHPSLVPLFEGARVVIISDNDDPGRKYANYVANLLYGWCGSLKLVEIPADNRLTASTVDSLAIPRIRDVSDYLLIQTIDNLLKIVDNTEEYIPIGAVTRDEFNAFRGINQYLWWELKKKPKRQPKYS